MARRKKAQSEPKETPELEKAREALSHAQQLISGGKGKQSIRYLEKAAELAKKAKNPMLQVAAIATMAEVYVHLGQYENAKEKAKETIRIARRYKNPAGLVRGHSVIATVYYLQGNMKKAHTEAEKGIEVVKKHKIPEMGVGLAVIAAETLYRMEKDEELKKKGKVYLSIAKKAKNEIATLKIKDYIEAAKLRLKEKKAAAKKKRKKKKSR